jgi:tyrosyl-tRNA synthetase
MTLSEELTWRGFVNQTTFKDVLAIDGEPLTFYWGVDPSAPSMTIGNLAAAMMARHFIDYGHKAVLLVGGATGLIGDPDGKSEERTLKSLEEIAKNKEGITGEYRRVFADKSFETVDNYDWFKDIGYLEFLRDVGKHVPMSQMLQREFVQSRLGEDGAGISYAEFSYALIQGYDFLHLSREYNVTLQLCGSDQWGNSIAGVELIRRIDAKEAHVWSTPLVVNKATGKKFGKTEDGAVWLDPDLTSPTQFYQFWINCDDEGVEDYMKIYTLLPKEELAQVMTEHRQDPKQRIAQKRLAEEVTRIVHGDLVEIAKQVTQALTGERTVSELNDAALEAVRKEIPNVSVAPDTEIAHVLVQTGLATSKTEARRLVQGNAVAINGQKVMKERLEERDFQNGLLLIRKGKAFKDSALVERA